MEQETIQKGIKRATELIKRFEGYRSEAYRDSSGVWTIGYGTTENVFPGQITNRKEATNMLREHIRTEVMPYIFAAVEVPVNPDQLAALISFVYNVGAGNFRGSTLLAKLNRGDYKGAAKEFPRWNKAGGKVLRGLVRRRAAEQNLFDGTEKKSE